MAKCLLIYSNTAGIGEIPVGLTTLQAVLKESGHIVRIFDTSLYEEFNNKNEAVKFGQFKQVENPIENFVLKKNPQKDLLQLAEDFEPDIVGV
jgi:hypothetical protein